MAEQATCWNCGKPERYAGEGLCETCYREMKHREAVNEALPMAKHAIEALRQLAGTAAGTDALKRALEMEHRTNQQLACRAIMAMLEKWNEDAHKGPGYYDARNEASVEFAASVFKNVPEELRYFPYI